MKYLLNKYKSLPVQVRASFWFLVCGFLQRGISMITTPIFTRLLSTDEYGQYSIFNSWKELITIFVTVNLFSGMYSKGLVQYEKRRDEYVSSTQGLCLTLVVLWMLVYLLFRDFWNSLFTLTTAQMLAMFAIIWSSASFQAWSQRQRTECKYRALVAISMAVTIIQPAIGIVFVLIAEDKVTARILSVALVSLTAYAWTFFVQLSQGKRFYNGYFWRDSLRLRIPLIPHALSLMILSSSDRIMIGNMVDSASAGIYSLAYSIAGVMGIFSSSMLQTIEPWLYKRIKAKNLDGMENVANASFAVVAGVNILLIAAAPEIVAIFAPVSYREAIWVIPPVAMSTYFTFAYTFFAVFEFYYEKTRLISYSTVIAAGMNILLNFIFIRIFGYYAAGYTTLACYIAFAVLHFCAMRKICRKELGIGLPYNMKGILMITAVFLAAGGVLTVTYVCAPARYLLIIVIAILLLVKRKLVIRQIKDLLNTRQHTAHTRGQKNGND